MRWITGIFVVLAAALPSASQDAPGKNKLRDYYPLKAGTKWTYEGDDGNGQKTQVTNRIAEIETIDGQALARLETVINGNVVMTEHLASTPKGVFRHRVKGVEVNPPVCILKYPFTEKQKWEVESMIGPQRLKMNFQSVRNEEVSSPSGKYETVSVVVETNVNDLRSKATSWYAPDVGLVKQITEMGDRIFDLELVKFEAGK